MVGRAIIIIVFLFSIIRADAQMHPVLYGGFEYYRHTGFKDDAFYNINIGSQLYQWKFLAPEVGVNFYTGIRPEREFVKDPDPNVRPFAIYKSLFTSFSVNFTPKLKFGNEEASLVIMPGYNIGKVRARGDYLVDKGDMYALEARESITRDQYFWTFAAGIEGNLLGLDHLWFSFYLKYTRVNSKEVIESLDFSTYNFSSNGGSKDGLGLAIRVYYDLFSAF